MISLYYTPDADARPNFELSVQQWLKHPYMIALNCSNSAWLLLLVLLNVTLVASNNTDTKCKIYCTSLTNLPLIIQYFLEPCLCYIDIDPETLGFDYSQLRSTIERNRTHNTKHIVLVQHWNGVVVDDSPLTRLGHDVIVVEDCTTIVCAYAVSQCPNIQLIDLNHKTHLSPDLSGSGTLLLVPSEPMYKRCIELLEILPIHLRMTDMSAHRACASIEHAIQRLDIARLNAQRFDNHFSRCTHFQKLAQTTYPTYAFRIVHPTVTAQHLVNFLRERKIQSSLIHNDPFVEQQVNINQLFTETVMIPCGHWIDDERFQKITAAVDEWYASTFKSLIPRLLQVDDYNKQILELVQPLFRENLATMTMTGFKNVIDKCINKSVYVIEQDDIIVAHGIMHLEFSPYSLSLKVYFDYIFVHPSYRRRGLATILISHMIEESKRQGGDNVDIYITDRVDYPLALLKKAGFSIDTPAIAFYSRKQVK